MKKIIAIFIILFGLSVGSYVIASTTTLRVVQTPSIHLYTGESSTATTVRITPYPKDLDGTKLTMTDFGTNPTFTVDPKLSGIEEIESFTGITDNGDNTATLTGVSRDLLSKYPYTTAGIGKTHGAGATVVFSNNPQLYGRLGSLENDQTWTGSNTFGSTTATMPRLDQDPSGASWTGFPNNYLVDLGILRSTAISGATNANFTATGLIQIATGIAAASSTQFGSTGAFNVLGAWMASSSPWSGATSTIVVTQNDHTINPNFIATSSAYTYNWAASSTFNGRVLSTATTTIAASGTSSAPLVLNSIPYAFPASQSASGTVLTTNGNGSLSWVTPSGRNYSLVSTAAVSASASGYGTSTILGIPAGVFTASSTIQINAPISCNSSGGTTCTVNIRNAAGTTIASCSLAITASVLYYGTIQFTIANQSSLSSQAISGTCELGANVVANGTIISRTFGVPATTASIDTSQATTWAIVLQSPASMTTTMGNGYSIVVTP